MQDTNANVIIKGIRSGRMEGAYASIWMNDETNKRVDRTKWRGRNDQGVPEVKREDIFHVASRLKFMQAVIVFVP